MRRWGLITRVKRMPSKLVNNWSTQTNFPPTHVQPTPTGRAKFFARFSTFAIFFKNVPDYRNRSNFARGPNSTHSSIWEKNIWGSEKKAHSLFSGPYNSQRSVEIQQKLSIVNFCQKFDKKLTDSFRQGRFESNGVKIFRNILLFRKIQEIMNFTVFSLRCFDTYV